MIEQNDRNQEFYEILKMVKIGLNDNKNNRVYDIACMEKFVIKDESKLKRPFSVSKVNITKKENRSALIHILELLLEDFSKGKEFYEKEEFLNLFNKCYNKPIFGTFKMIKKPNNLAEVNLMFDNIYEILVNNNYCETTKVVNEVMCDFGNLLVYFYNQMENNCKVLDELYELISNLLVSVKKGDLLLVDDMEDTREKLNKHVYLLEPTEETKNIGDYIINFVQEYNSKRMPECNDESYRTNLLKYYGNIVNTKFKEFNYELLPSYDDSDYICYMDNLEDMLQDNYSKDKQFIKKFVAVTMHHQGYYRR